MPLLNNLLKNISKKDVISWALFDFANSSYSILILSFVFPIYFKEVIAGSQYGDFYWGLIGSLSVLLAGIFSPIIGAIADYDSRKKSKFVAFAVISVIATALLYFVSAGSIIYASSVFIASHLFFMLASTLYDSFLAHVSSKETAGVISGLGYGLGYFGGIVAMLLLKPFYGAGYIGSQEAIYKLTFPLTALFFLVFSLPSFIFIKEQDGEKKKEKFLGLVIVGFKNTISTFKEFKKRKDLAWFLIAFYLMNDALVTIFAFASLYATTTLSLTTTEIGIFFLIVQVIAIPSSILFGFLSDRKSHKKILLVSLIGWIIVTLLLVVAKSKTEMYAFSIIGGLIIGGSQSVARSWYSLLVPSEKRFGLFGFNSFASKISAFFGPIIFGAISSFSGSQRLAMLSLLPFFIASFVMFLKVKES